MNWYKLPGKIARNDSAIDQLVSQFQQTQDQAEQYELLRRLFRTRLQGATMTVIDWTKQALRSMGINENAELLIWEAAKRSHTNFMATLSGQIRSSFRRQSYETLHLSESQQKALRRFGPIIMAAGQSPTPEQVLTTYMDKRWGGLARVQAAILWWDQKYGQLADQQGLPKSSLLGPGYKNRNPMRTMREAFDDVLTTNPDLAQQLGIDPPLYLSPSGPMYLTSEMVYPTRYGVNAMAVMDAMNLISDNHPGAMELLQKYPHRY
jgi:hypothetical protein